MLKLRLSMFIPVIAAIVIFSACNGNGSDNGISEAAVAGEWKLVNFESDGSSEKYKECDSKTIWNFTEESAEPLQDGTEANKLITTAPEDCKFFDFESSWTVTDGQLFISSTRVGGMGGASNAGLFNVEEFNENRMVIKTFDNIYTFER